MYLSWYLPKIISYLNEEHFTIHFNVSEVNVKQKLYVFKVFKMKNNEAMLQGKQ